MSTIEEGWRLPWSLWRIRLGFLVYGVVCLGIGLLTLVFLQRLAFTANEEILGWYSIIAVVPAFIFARSRFACMLYQFAVQPSALLTQPTLNGKTRYETDPDVTVRARAALAALLHRLQPHMFSEEPSDENRTVRAQGGYQRLLNTPTSSPEGSAILADQATCAILRGLGTFTLGEFEELVDRLKLFLATEDPYVWDSDRWVISPSWMPRVVGRKEVNNVGAWPFATTRSLSRNLLLWADTKQRRAAPSSTPEDNHPNDAPTYPKGGSASRPLPKPLLQRWPRTEARLMPSTGPNSCEATFTVSWRNGIHARPAANVARLAMRFTSQVTLDNGEMFVDAKDVMGLLELAAPSGTRLSLRATGADAVAATEAFLELAENDFGMELREGPNGPVEFPPYPMPPSR